MTDSPITDLPSQQVSPPEKHDRSSTLPKWSFYGKMSQMKLSEAVALSLNWSPKKIRFAFGNNRSLKTAYRSRLGMARREATPSGKIKVAEKGRNNDGSDWIIDIRSFVTLAEQYDWTVPVQFRTLGQHPISKTRAKQKTKRHRHPPEQFVHNLQKVLLLIAAKAVEKGEPFDQRSMHGKKRDFWMFAYKSCAGINIKFSSFDTYIHGICSFKRGRNPAPDYYLNLFDGSFPEIE